MKFDVVIQARMGSNRMQGKVLKIYKKFSILDILIKRVKKLNLINRIIVTTTTKKKDNRIVNFCKKNKILYFRGSESDVLSRYYKTAKKFKLKNIIRLTSDCPLIDINTLRKMIKNYKKLKIDFYANTVPHPCKFPDGSDIEIFSFKTLKNAFENSSLPSEREHVTFYMWKTNKFKIKKYNEKKDLSKYRYTVDYPDDFKLICSMIDYFGDEIINISMTQIIRFIDKNPKLTLYQKKIYRSIGWQESLSKDKKFLN